MKYNPKNYSIVKRAIIEARIRKWFKRRRKRSPSPSELLNILLKPKRGIHLRLTRKERNYFIRLIRETYRANKIILKYRKKYARRSKIFYKEVFGFPPRKSQSIKIIWNTYHVHFLFKKNDLIAFWRKVQWGPGCGGYYSVGDKDIKIKVLRGLISFGREEKRSIKTREIMQHESVHAFEGFIKKRKSPSGKKSLMFYAIKSELNAYLHNFKNYKKTIARRINERARLGLGREVREQIEDYVSYNETEKRIRKIKTKIRKSKSEINREKLGKKLEKLKERLEIKKKKRNIYLSLYRKTVNQVKNALRTIPVEVLHTVIYEIPFGRLYKKIPETVKTYKKMKYKWYRRR